MKQAVIAVGFALMSCSLMANATTAPKEKRSGDENTTTTPKEKRSGDENATIYLMNTDNGKNLDESQTMTGVASIESKRTNASDQSTTAATDGVKVLKYRTSAIFQGQTEGEVDYIIHTKKSEDVGTIPTTTMSDPLPNRLDFTSLEGRSTPFDVPVLSDGLQVAAHVSSGTNGSAQIVTGWNGFAADHWFGGGDAPFVAAAGPLAIDFPDLASKVSLTYGVDGQWKKLDADARFALSIVLLDDVGNLVDSRNIVVAPSEIANPQAVEIVSAEPFQKLVLSPTDDSVMLISGLMYDSSTFEPKLAPDVESRKTFANETGFGTAKDVGIGADQEEPMSRYKKPSRQVDMNNGVMKGDFKAEVDSPIKSASGI